MFRVQFELKREFKRYYIYLNQKTLASKSGKKYSETKISETYK